MFSGLLQKELFKGGCSSAEMFFQTNYCHACHTRFAVFFPLTSCCVSSLFHNDDGDDSENVTHVESQMQGNFQGIELLGAAPKFRERKNCLQNIIPKVRIISRHEWKHPGRGPPSQ